MKLFAVLAALAVLFPLGFCPPALALSDAEYKRLIKESPAFAVADKRLVRAWENLRRTLDKQAYQALLTDQRDWLSRRRSQEAREEKNAPSQAEAYAVVTERRAAHLEDMLARGASPDKPAQAPPPGGPARDKDGPEDPARSASRVPAGPEPDKPAGPERASPAGSEGVDQAAREPAAAFLHDRESKAGENGAASDKATVPPAPERAPGGSAPAEGVYVMEYGEILLRAAGEGVYDLIVARRAPDRTWVCASRGRAAHVGDTLILLDADHPESAPVEIVIEGDRLIITRSFPVFCASGGALGGVYVKKPGTTPEEAGR